MILQKKILAHQSRQMLNILVPLSPKIEKYWNHPNNQIFLHSEHCIDTWWASHKLWGFTNCKCNQRNLYWHFYWRRYSHFSLFCLFYIRAHFQYSTTKQILHMNIELIRCFIWYIQWYIFRILKKCPVVRRHQKQHRIQSLFVTSKLVHRHQTCFCRLDCTMNMNLRFPSKNITLVFTHWPYLLIVRLALHSCWYNYFWLPIGYKSIWPICVGNSWASQRFLQQWKHPWWQGSCGQHGAHLGPTGPRWAPCWPHLSGMKLLITYMQMIHLA